jgi:hypothetical protein
LRTDEEEARFCTGLLLRTTGRGVRDWEGLACREIEGLRARVMVLFLPYSGPMHGLEPLEFLAFALLEHQRPVLLFQLLDQL